MPDFVNFCEKRVSMQALHGYGHECGYGVRMFDQLALRGFVGIFDAENELICIVDEKKAGVLIHLINNAKELETFHDDPG